MHCPHRNHHPATAIVAMIGNGHEFSGRQFAAWLGLTAGAIQLGGRPRLGTHHQGGDGIPAQPSLIRGAASVLGCQGRSDSDQHWRWRCRTPRLLEGGGGIAAKKARRMALAVAAQRRELQDAGRSTRRSTQSSPP